MYRREYYLTKKQRNTLVAWVMLSPVLLWLVAYKYIALLYNIFLSFGDRSFTGEITIVGLDHWEQIYREFLNQGIFWEVFWNTIILFLTIPAGIAVALGLAVLLNQKFPGRNLYRAVFFLPYITMTVAVAVIWEYMFNTEAGVINEFLLSIGIINEGISWLGDGTWAMVSLFTVQVWKTTGFFLIILLAGLQTIPEQVYEVARIDGASRWQRFRHITLPLLRPTIGVCALVGLVVSFRLFDLVFVMTGGGPAQSTEILLTWIYKQSFNRSNFGYGAAMSVVMVALTLIVAGIGIKLQQENYS
ncbi:carbohydrate ABC transporter permease [Halovenus marina]|uniref:carbohydrate ABC transporter permease n=1 Tax=Halovenus marina TaxID=3396621 RepID=UPI003F542A97